MAAASGSVVLNRLRGSSNIDYVCAALSGAGAILSKEGSRDLAWHLQHVGRLKDKTTVHSGRGVADGIQRGVNGIRACI